jgi:hypothetical protein
MGEANAVFDVLRSFRALAYRLQLWLTLLGFLALAAAVVGLAAGAIGAWSLAVGGGLLAASVLWALLWRWRTERAFWRGSRLPRRGAPARLPLE